MLTCALFIDSDDLVSFQSPAKSWTLFSICVIATLLLLCSLALLLYSLPWFLLWCEDQGLSLFLQNMIVNIWRCYWWWEWFLDQVISYWSPIPSPPNATSTPALRKCTSGVVTRTNLLTFSPMLRNSQFDRWQNSLWGVIGIVMTSPFSWSKPLVIVFALWMLESGGNVGKK